MNRFKWLRVLILRDFPDAQVMPLLSPVEHLSQVNERSTLQMKALSVKEGLHSDAYGWEATLPTGLTFATAYGKQQRSTKSVTLQHADKFLEDARDFSSVNAATRKGCPTGTRPT